jgi:hypothetical protein
MKDQSKVRRRWMSFSLRTLLLAVMLASILFGWLASKVRQARRQRVAVAAIEKIGGVVKYDYEIKPDGGAIYNATLPGPPWLREWMGRDFVANVASVKISQWKIPAKISIGFESMWHFVGIDNGQALTDVRMANFREFPELKVLELQGVQFRGHAEGHLQGLAKLEQLSLQDSGITDAQLANLRGMRQLKELNLQRTRISDAGLLHLHSLTRLETLKLDHTRVRGEGLTHLASLERLQNLSLSGCPISDSGLAYLPAMQNLKKLDLDGVQITNTGLVHLRNASGLKDLNLWGNHISDAGLPSLYELTNLVNLEVHQTAITDDGCDKLRKVLPKLQTASTGNSRWPRAPYFPRSWVVAYERTVGQSINTISLWGRTLVEVPWLAMR